MQFRVLKRGEPFLFKLHSPRNFIVGGGFFIHWSRLPVELAWETFGEKNGVNSAEEMKRRIEKYRSRSSNQYEVGCILLTAPFFFREEAWISISADWKPSIVRGKTYSFDMGYGKQLWRQVQNRLKLNYVALEGSRAADTGSQRYGSPIEIYPRLGQGIFRVLVTDRINGNVQ